MHRVDLNADMGESFGAYTLGDDDALLRSVTSASIACGFHAGDPGTMARAVAACLAQGVALGAHPGLPDLVGFGRRALAVTPAEARDLVTYQIGALAAFAARSGSSASSTSSRTAPCIHDGRTRPALAASHRFGPCARRTRT